MYTVVKINFILNRFKRFKPLNVPMQVNNIKA